MRTAQSCACRGPAQHYIHRCNCFSLIPPEDQTDTMVSCRKHELFMQAILSHEAAHDAFERAAVRQQDAQRNYRAQPTPPSYEADRAARGTVGRREVGLTAALEAAGTAHDNAVRAGCTRVLGHEPDPADPLRVAGLCGSCGGTSERHAR